MFEFHDYTKPIVIASGEDFLDVCRSNDVIRYAVAQGYAPLLPRLRLETVEMVAPGKISKETVWFLECWWRSAKNGTLGWYTKLNLKTGMVKEIRELDQTVSVSGVCSSEAGNRYLEQGAAAVNDALADQTDAEALDGLWQAAVPAELRDYALQVPAEQNLGSYLLPLEALTSWNWEKLKELLLKRYDTTEENILDYIAYQNSGSEKRYISPEHREEAKKCGLRFWGDGNDDV